MPNKNVLNYVPIIFSLLVLTLVLPFALWQVNNPQSKQELRSKAADPTPAPLNYFSFSPSTGSVTVSNTVFPSMPLDLQVYTPFTPGENGISGIRAIFTFDNSLLSLTNGDITFNPNLTNSDPTSPNKWTFSKTLTSSGTLTRVIIEGYNLYSNVAGWKDAISSPQKIATLNFSTKTISQNSVNTNLTWDTSSNANGSAIIAKSGNSNIIAFPVPGHSYSLYLDTIAPNPFITSGCPSAPLRNPNITFVWSGNDVKNDTTTGTPTSEIAYSYQLDSEPWSSYSFTTTVTFNLTVGSHTFALRAKDLLGNSDSPLAICNFSYLPVTNLKLNLLMQGLTPLSSPVPLHYTKDLDIEIKKDNITFPVLSATANYNNANGYYETANIMIPNIYNTGTYEVLVKGPWHLRRNLGATIISVNADNVLDRNSEAYKLLRGDITDDNYISLEDITAILDVWTQSKVPVSTIDLRKYDLTEDGFIDIIDINCILSNWTVSARGGD